MEIFQNHTSYHSTAVDVASHKACFFHALHTQPTLGIASISPLLDRKCYPPWKRTNVPWKSMVGSDVFPTKRVPFLGAMLVFGGVYKYPEKKVGRNWKNWKIGKSRSSFWGMFCWFLVVFLFEENKEKYPKKEVSLKLQVIGLFWVVLVTKHVFCISFLQLQLAFAKLTVVKSLWRPCTSPPPPTNCTRSLDSDGLDAYEHQYLGRGCAWLHLLEIKNPFLHGWGEKDYKPPVTWITKYM